jgi:putative hydrolase of the HAD superfamily
VITTVVFDLYETLITESVIRPTRASSLASTLGLDHDAYRREWKARRPRVVRGEMSFAEALTEISHTLVGDANLSVVEEICEGRIREKAIVYSRVTDAVSSLVATLAREGVTLGVISNGFREDVVGWSEFSLAPRFKCAVFSCAERVAKPDPRIYLRAVQRLHADPRSTLYVGDGGDDELAGAERAGLRAARAAWFVAESPRKGTWPELRHCQDVLSLTQKAE